MKKISTETEKDVVCDNSGLFEDSRYTLEMILIYSSLFISIVSFS